MKAKDLAKGIPKSSVKEEEEDQVTAAYESLSKKLESIRKGEEPEDEDAAPAASGVIVESEEEVEMEIEPEEESDETSRESQKEDSEEEINEPEEDDTEDEEIEEEEEKESPKETFKPRQDDDDEIDPLDDEGDETEESVRESEKSEDMGEIDEEQMEEVVEHETFPSKKRVEDEDSELAKPRNNETAEDENVDTLEDLVDQDSKDDTRQRPTAIRESEEETPKSNRPMPEKRGTIDYDMPRGEEEEETHIPPLRNGGGGQQLPYKTSYSGPHSEAAFDDFSEYPPSKGQEQSNSGHLPNPNQYFGNRQTPKKRSSKLHLLILALIGLAVIGGTVYLLKNQFPGQKSEPTPAPTQAPEPTVAPTPTPVPVERSKFKVRILNGTSTTGLAGQVSTKLKDLGYQIDRTGNATNSAFTKTVIRVKASATGLSDQLIKDLAPDYQAEGTPTLKDSDAADGEVILGK